MKDRRSIVLSAIPDNNMRQKLDEVMRDYPKDGVLWFDAYMRLGHVGAIKDVLDSRLKGIDADRQKFSEMLSEFEEKTHKAAINIAEGAINSSIYNQIDEQLISRALEVCEIILNESRAARDRDMAWINKVLMRQQLVIIFCLALNGLALFAGYQWGAAGAKESTTISSKTAKSSPFATSPTLAAPALPVPTVATKDSPSSVSQPLASGQTIAAAPIIKKSPKNKTIVEDGKDILIFEFSTAESACPENIAYRIGPESWNWICANKVHVLTQNKPIPFFEK